jgi:hypothetical protein
LLALLRYVLFAAVGLVVASGLFFLLNVIVTANYDAGTGFIERWIIRATCNRFELDGTVRAADGTPVPFAIIEVSYFDERLATRSGSDGRFTLEAAELVCDRRPPENVGIVVVAEDFRPKRQSARFDAGSIDLVLDRRDFRP